ncbi:NAD kinase-like [Adelges cooleyi]|uniref:NAD kinase-like n=1 Tax=Adelges cooleyi TaxID=133065 RepID=UPI00217F9721|nr:NAD kinase-like [Adelges cooleyi]
MKSIISYFLIAGTILSTAFCGYSETTDCDLKLTWSRKKLSVLVVKKKDDEGAVNALVDVIIWLIQKKRVKVFVEKAVANDLILINNLKLSAVRQELSCFENDNAIMKDTIDFIICLGGDGTLLYTCSLFQETVPPIISFNLGSMGFLAPFSIQHFQKDITKVLEGCATIFRRDRIACKLFKKEDDLMEHPIHFTVLNDVAMRRISSSLTNLNVYHDGYFVTNVQADGLIISTATGSTAYSASSGASLLYPSVQAILISTICSHSLTSRPIMVPLDGELKITLHPASRENVSVVFDNKNDQELRIGDSLYITKSVYPVPTINSENQITDWFSSLAKTLNWNV